MMIAFMKIAALLLVAIIAMALTAEARQLLDYYDDCYNREYSNTRELYFETNSIPHATFVVWTIV